MKTWSEARENICWDVKTVLIFPRSKLFLSFINKSEGSYKFLFYCWLKADSWRQKLLAQTVQSIENFSFPIFSKSIFNRKCLSLHQKSLNMSIALLISKFPTSYIIKSNNFHIYFSQLGRNTQKDTNKLAFYVRLCYDVLLEVHRFGDRRYLTKLERVGRRSHWIVENHFIDKPFIRLYLRSNPW